MVAVADTTAQRLEMTDPEIENSSVVRCILKILVDHHDLFQLNTARCINVLAFFQKYEMTREINTVRAGLKTVYPNQRPTPFQAFVLAAQLEDHAVCQRIIQSSWSGRLIGGSWLGRWGHPSAKNDKDLLKGDPNGRIFDFATISEYQPSLLPRHVLWASLRASGVAQEQRFADDVTRSQLMAVEYTRLMKLRGMPFLCLVSTKPIGQELVANQTEHEAKRRRERERERERSTSSTP